ncbi:enoyl-CoA hydratase/isomerase family protein [Candidatus Poriferisocius sp.]|uniref:enoyl-CoA hydratase/isomerase family protein n=1 Tax=Candidatus Poriferisocius sp. TaxID=3101276 RepID=UPI003B5C2BBA
MDNASVLVQARHGDDHVVEIVINRPEELNTLNNDLASEVIDACRTVRADEDVWVVLLRASGERAFCAGADLKERNSMTPDQWWEQRALFRAMYAELRNIPQPLVAAVQGYALGGGTELAISADIVLASASAVFGLTEPRLGIIPGGGGTQLLPRLVGLARAKHLLLTGTRFSAEEALRWGLVAEVVDFGALDATTDAYVSDLLACSPVSTRAIKRAVHEGADVALVDAMGIENEAYERVLESDDRLEGIAAFNERRQPAWSGH